MDILTPQQRSALMARIRSRNTTPELSVRRLAHALGYSYRLHARGLPGTPDLVFRSRRAVIFVHGCFWHRHSCSLAYSPKSRREFWNKKFSDNVTRDKKAVRSLRRAGWKVLVVWECQSRRPEVLADRLKKFLGPARANWKRQTEQKIRAKAKLRPLRRSSNRSI